MIILALKLQNSKSIRKESKGNSCNLRRIFRPKYFHCYFFNYEGGYLKGTITKLGSEDHSY